MSVSLTTVNTRPVLWPRSRGKKKQQKKTFTWLWTRAGEVKLNRTLQVSIPVHWNTSSADSCCYISRLVDFTGTFTSQDLFSLVLSPKSLVQAILHNEIESAVPTAAIPAALSLGKNVLALNGTVDFTVIWYMSVVLWEKWVGVIARVFTQDV